MDRDALREFARRDWAAVAASKTRAWHDLKVRHSAADVLGIVNRMRIHAQRLQPNWPTADDRRADLLVHQRVGEALRAVASRPR